MNELQNLITNDALVLCHLCAIQTIAMPDNTREDKGVMCTKTFCTIFSVHLHVQNSSMIKGLLKDFQL